MSLKAGVAGLRNTSALLHTCIGAGHTGPLLDRSEDACDLGSLRQDQAEANIILVMDFLKQSVVGDFTLKQLC